MQGHPSLCEMKWRCNATGRVKQAKHSCLRALFGVSSLRSLDFSECGIDDEGASVIADVLAKTWSSLTELNLESNKIGVAGCKALASVVRKVVFSLLEAMIILLLPAATDVVGHDGQRTRR